MARERPLEIITLPNVLKARLGGMAPPSAAVTAAADAALATLKQEFKSWMAEEVARLNDARDRWAAIGDSAESRRVLAIAATHFQGAATGFEYPLPARIAASLADLCALPPAKTLPAKLVSAHLDAIRAIMRTGSREKTDPVGMALIAELEAQVAATA